MKKTTRLLLLGLLVLIYSNSFAQTSVEDDFNDNTKTGWSGGKFTLTEENGELTVQGKRTSVWDAWDFNFDKIDISSAPYVNMKIKATHDVAIAVSVGYDRYYKKSDGTYGFGYTVSYPKKIKLGNYYWNAEHNIITSDNYADYAFSFSEFLTTEIIVDLDTIGGVITEVKDLMLKHVRNLHFLPNPIALFEFNGDKKIYIDDLKVGTAAKQIPSIASVRAQTFTVINSGTPSYTIKLNDISDGIDDAQVISIAASSSNTALVPNPTVNYTSGRTGELVLAPSDNMTGTTNISVVVSAPGPISKTITFPVAIVANKPPVLSTPNTQLIVKGEKTSIEITGIGDGNFESNQEVTISASSSNTSVLPNPVVSYDGYASTAKLEFNPSGTAAPGSMSTITLTLTDAGGTAQGGNNVTTVDFDVYIYDDVNKIPAFDLIKDFSIPAPSGVQQYKITGISDGDNETQAMGFEVTNSNESIITNVSVGEIENGSAILYYELTGTLGSSVISLTLTDSAGTAVNNGDLSYNQTFTISAIEPPVTGLVVDFEDGGVPGDYGFSAESGYTLNIENGSLHIHCDYPSNKFPGMWWGLGAVTGGKLLDISKHTYMSIKIKNSPDNNNGIDDETLMLLFLWDNDDDRDYGNSKQTLYFPEDGEWNEFLINFSGSFGVTDKGQIDSSKIASILMNLDNRRWYPVVGDYWIDEIRLGDSVSVAPPIELNIGNVPNQNIKKGSLPKSIELNNLSDGVGGYNMDISYTIENPSLVTNVSIGDIIDGKAILTYTLAENMTGQCKITLVADNPGELDDIKDTIVFNIHVIDDQIVSDTVTLDYSTTFQTFKGLGGTAYSNNDGHATLISDINDLNWGVMRIFGRLDNIEPVNDNSDPYVLSRESLVVDQALMETIRKINEQTNCHTFFYTPLSPPAWMKNNYAEYPFTGQVPYANNNHLNPVYYEEFAEFLLEVVLTIKEQAGVELYAISIQNEPAFNEPYASMKVSPEEFVEILKVVGPRFEAEGLSTKILMSEDVVHNGTLLSSRINAVNDDPDARKYLNVIAYHGYALDGIEPDFGSNTVLSNVAALAENTLASDVWITESSGWCDSWNGEWGYSWDGKPLFNVGPMVVAGGIYSNLKYAKITGWADLNTTSNLEGKDQLKAAFKHYTNYVDHDAQVVDSRSSDDQDILALGFINPDNTKAAVLINWDSVPRMVKLEGTQLPSTFRVISSEEHKVLQEKATILDSIIMLPAKSITTITDDLKNLQPEIDPVSNISIILADGAAEIQLTGINDGNTDAVQAVSINATSSATNIATVGVTYTSDASTGTLTVTPVDYGQTTITLTIQDDGGTANGGLDTKTISFTVEVRSTENKKPTIDALSNITIKEDEPATINLTGISDGDNNTQDITIEVSSDNTGLIPTPVINYSNNAATGTLSITPVADLSGTATITLILTDNGGNATNNGDQSITKTFEIKVDSVNDIPVTNPVDDIVITSFVATYPIILDGIADGDPDRVQDITITATSSNPSLIAAEALYMGDVEGVVKLNFLEEASGTGVITIVIQDNGGTANGGIDKLEIEVNVTLDLPDAIVHETASDILLYPIPASNILTIALQNNLVIESYQVIDMTGKLMTVEKNSADKMLQIPIYSLSQGTYILELNTNKGLISSSFIKK